MLLTHSAKKFLFYFSLSYIVIIIPVQTTVAGANHFLFTAPGLGTELLPDLHKRKDAVQNFSRL